MSGVAKVLLRELEVAREPVFVARGRFSECKGPVYFEQAMACLHGPHPFLSCC